MVIISGLIVRNGDVEFFSNSRSVLPYPKSYTLSLQKLACGVTASSTPNLSIMIFLTLDAMSDIILAVF